ncbi:proteoglycan 4 isoform X3 [Anabrus simplex]|uniref:proteoglycan 4 isoform X3 n=1 Tax=Anabrus simplex TaxID=316456 RepID=UPI0034DDADE6
MIGSFWNLCRACPSMPVDKLHSEYRSTYRWHEYTGPRQEVVRRPPASAPAAGGGGNASKLQHTKSTEEDSTDGGNPGTQSEPALPRRKKHPELAYKTHEFLTMGEVGGSDDSLDSTVSFDRARMIASYPPPAPAPTAGPLSNAISRISTEYRLQFAWPRGSRGSRATRGRTTRTEDMKAGGAGGPPRKSLSMGAIRPTGNVGPAPVHKKRSADYDHGDEGTSELEPLVGPEVTDGPASLDVDELRGEEKIQDEIHGKEEKSRRRKEFKTEYKKKFRPFSQYDYVEGKFQKKKEADSESLPVPLPELPKSDSWYREVIELRKKAGEYKHRGWGTELIPQHIAELYNKQMTLWEQVSRRSSLSALSLASTTPRSISKEEKEKENNKKSSPTKLVSTRSTALRSSLDSEKKKAEKVEDIKKEIPRSRKEYLIRHHLERTTGATDGALLPSPTREKLEPVIPRQREEDSTVKSPQKASPKSSPRSARSQSMGPGVSNENRSPKRQPRTPSAAPSVSTHKGQVNGPVQVERRPRPTPGTANGRPTQPQPRAPARPQPRTTSLSTTGPSRPKSSSVSLKSEEGKSHHTIKTKPMPAKSVVNGAKLRGDRTKVAESDEPSTEDERQDQEVDGVPKTGPSDAVKEEGEPAVVKSPPEPTRVKSPEQIIMRSPEPVNWTVPLDTGKTFTVTQNVRDGELMNRPHSEVKAWTPPAVPPPAPQSAPPQLPEQTQHSSGWRSPVSETEPIENIGTSKEPEEKEKEDDGTVASSTSPTEFETPVTGTTLKCLEDPSFSFESTSGDRTGTGPIAPGKEMGYRVLEDPGVPSDVLYQPTEQTGSQCPYRVLESPATTQDSPTTPLPLVSPSSGRSLASDVLEKARTRFDKFWGKGKESSDKEGKV